MAFFDKIIDPLNITGRHDFDNPDVQIPDFFEDSLFQETQTDLNDLSSNILDGDLPSFFEPIGNISGSEQFENLLGDIISDTTQAVGEQISKRGTGRSGVANELISDSVAEVSNSLRFDTLIQDIDDKKGLLEFGANVKQGVGNNALNFTQLKNQFNLNKAGLGFHQNEINEQRDNQKGDVFANLLKSGARLALGTTTGGASELGFLAADAAGVNPLGNSSRLSGSGNVSSGGFNPVTLNEFRLKSPGTLTI